MANEAQLNSILQDIESWNQWRETTPKIKINLRKANLNKSDLSHANLKDASLHQAKLRKANLVQANLSQADLSNANLNQANLHGANLRRSNLIKADLVVTNLSETDLRRADLRRANLSKANLSKVRLCGSNLRGADLRNSNLKQAILIGANLTGADLTGANLAEANLTGANLTGANLTETNLHHADVINSKLTGSIWLDANLKSTQFKNNLGLTQKSQRALEQYGANFVSEQRQLYHYLVITDTKGTRAMLLEANNYTLGRDAQAGIRIYDQSVSRNHAVLLRLFDTDNKSFFHLVDGDLEGNQSTNGIKVNQCRLRSQILKSGDEIKLGQTIMQYHQKELTVAELKRNLKQIPN